MWEWLTGKRGRKPFDPRSLGTPWGNRPSIYEHIRRSIDPATGRLNAPAIELPDEEPKSDEKIRFSAGSLDGITRHGIGETDAPDVAKVVFTQLQRVLNTSDPKVFAVLHGYLLEHPTLSYVDQLNPMMTRLIPESGADIAALGRHLLLNAADRDVVKFAINLVGVCGDASDHSALLTIGTHDEFTLYAVVAMGHSGGDIRSTWEMARRVSGWGRIQCVGRLDQPIDDPEIRRWLLTDGYDNAVMIEETAVICARRGGLLEALVTDPDNRAILDGAAEILAALARGQPGEGMGGYDDGAQATERFLSIVADHDRPAISWLLACRDIQRFAREEPTVDKKLPGWTNPTRQRCIQAVEHIKSKPLWTALVENALNTADDGLHFNSAAIAAKYIGIDPWEHQFRRLLAGKDQWYWVLETTDPARLDRVLAHANSHIDLTQIATGHGRALGFGPAFKEHGKLDWVLQALRRWPGRGSSFIKAGLHSPVIRNRWGATRAALRWPPDERNVFLEAVKRAHAAEDRADLKAALTRILAGEVDEPDPAEPPD